MFHEDVVGIFPNLVANTTTISKCLFHLDKPLRRKRVLGADVDHSAPFRALLLAGQRQVER